MGTLRTWVTPPCAAYFCLRIFWMLTVYTQLPHEDGVLPCPPSLRAGCMGQVHLVHDVDSSGIMVVWLSTVKSLVSVEATSKSEVVSQWLSRTR
jgi:hypothetical protein